jgi:hypothetical protein
MKDQYCGDLNDYRKYALLRHLSRSGFTKLLVAWMLTPDDGGSDGQRRQYLDDPTRFSSLDPPLYDALRSLRCHGHAPAVTRLQASGVLPSAQFYSALVPDRFDARSKWRLGLLEKARKTDWVFVDPDNGIEVKSRPMGRKNSSKYVAWDELTAIWKTGASILIYQHFAREKRIPFTRRLAREFAARTSATHLEGFCTPDVLFLLAAQDRHAEPFRKACSGFPSTCWIDHVNVMGVNGSGAPRR